MSHDYEASIGFLTGKELDWLLDKTGSISKSYRYKIKSSLRRKVHAFIESELPLLLKKGIFHLEDGLCYSLTGDPEGKISLGKAKVSGKY